MWKQESFSLASRGDVWVAEEPLTVPLSSDEGSGHASRSGMCCVAEVMVEGRRAIGGSRSTEQASKVHKVSSDKEADLVISAAGRRQNPFLQSSGDLRIVYCCYLMMGDVILFRDKPTFLGFFSYSLKFLLRSIHGQFRNTDQMKNLVTQF